MVGFLGSKSTIEVLTKLHCYVFQIRSVGACGLVDCESAIDGGAWIGEADIGVEEGGARKRRKVIYYNKKGSTMMFDVHKDSKDIFDMIVIEPLQYLCSHHNV